MIKQRRRVEGGRLADGARLRRARARPTSSTQHGAASDRRARVAALDARGAGARRAARARRSAATTSTSACGSPISATTASARACRGSACRSPTSSKLDRVLVVGSFLRKDHPLLAQRLRQAAKKGAQVSMLHSVDDDWLMPVAHKAIVAAVAAAGSAGARSSSPRRRRAGKPVPAGAGRRRRRPRGARRSPRACVRARSARCCSATARVQHPDASQLTRWRRRSPTSPARRSASSTEAANTRRRHLARRAAAARRAERAGDARRAAQGVPAAARRAGVRLRQPGRRARRAREGGARAS